MSRMEMAGTSDRSRTMLRKPENSGLRTHSMTFTSRAAIGFIIACIDMRVYCEK